MAKVTIDMASKDHADIWDDSLLIKAYNESLKLGKEQVAKSIATATNNRLKVHTKSESESSLASAEQTAPLLQSAGTEFKVGDYVRTTYHDGIDYEAQITVMGPNQETCLIRYLGYENEEIVSIAGLLPTWGKKAQKEQMRCACVAASDSSAQPIGSTDAPSAADPHRIKATKKSLRRGFARKNHHTKFFDRNREPSVSMLPPPPPMPPMIDDLATGGDSEYLSAMLMSWYMSGYYTGLYQGRKQSMSNNKPNAE